MEESVSDPPLPKKNGEKSECSASTEELDYCVVTYLEILEQYNQSYEELQSHMKSAFFDLAKSKIALGPSRIGPNSYDMTSHLPIKTIIIQDEKDAREHEKHVQQSEPGLSFILSLNRFERATSTKVSSSSDVASRMGYLGLDNTIRKRKPIQVDDLSSNSTTENSEQVQSGRSDDKNDEDRQIDRIQELPDPILQFSALPPPSLRSAQKGFSTTLESIVKLSNLRLKLFQLDKLIQFYKQSIFNSSEKNDQHS